MEVAINIGTDDPHVALVIPETSADAGVDLSQAEYDALLTDDERAALIAELPADWRQGAG